MGGGGEVVRGGLVPLARSTTSSIALLSHRTSGRHSRLGGGRTNFLRCDIQTIDNALDGYTSIISSFDDVLVYSFLSLPLSTTTYHIYLV